MSVLGSGLDFESLLLCLSLNPDVLTFFDSSPHILKSHSNTSSQTPSNTLASRVSQEVVPPFNRPLGRDTPVRAYNGGYALTRANSDEMTRTKKNVARFGENFFYVLKKVLKVLTIEEQLSFYKSFAQAFGVDPDCCSEEQLFRIYQQVRCSMKLTENQLVAYSRSNADNLAFNSFVINFFRTLHARRPGGQKFLSTPVSFAQTLPSIQFSSSVIPPKGPNFGLKLLREPSDEQVNATAVHASASSAVDNPLIQEIKRTLERGVDSSQPTQLQLISILKNIHELGKDQLDWSRVDISLHPQEEPRLLPSGGYRVACKYKIKVSYEGKDVEFEIERPVYLSNTHRDNVPFLVQRYGETVSELALLEFKRSESPFEAGRSKYHGRFAEFDLNYLASTLSQSYFVMNCEADQDNRITAFKGVSTPKSDGKATIPIHFKEEFMKTINESIKTVIPNRQEPTSVKDKDMKAGGQKVNHQKSSYQNEMEIAFEKQLEELLECNAGEIPSPENIPAHVLERGINKDEIDKFHERHLHLLQEFNSRLDANKLSYLERNLLADYLVMHRNRVTAILRSNKVQEEIFLKEHASLRGKCFETENKSTIERLKNDYENLKSNPILASADTIKGQELEELVKLRKTLNASLTKLNQLRSPSQNSGFNELKSKYIEAIKVLHYKFGCYRKKLNIGLTAGEQAYLRSLDDVESQNQKIMEIGGEKNKGVLLRSDHVDLGFKMLQEEFKNLIIRNPEDPQIEHGQLLGVIKLLPKDKSGIIAVPVHINCHWIGVIVDLDNRFITFLDSKPNDERTRLFDSYLKDIVDLCQGQYNQQFTTNHANETRQADDDGHSCGAWVVGMVRDYLNSSKDSKGNMVYFNDADPDKEKLLIQRRIIQNEWRKFSLYSVGS